VEETATRTVQSEGWTLWSCKDLHLLKWNFINSCFGVFSIKNVISLIDNHK
jgi:hypothetical protein